MREQGVEIVEVVVAPALVIRGRTSRMTTTAALEQMAARRARTRFVELDAGHVVHVDCPELEGR